MDLDFTAVDGPRGDELGLNEDELAFYDALETNHSAVAVLGDATLRRLLRTHGSPPDKQEHATQLVLAQAEVVCEEWAVQL